jgi:hypothetical protein
LVLYQTTGPVALVHLGIIEYIVEPAGIAVAAVAVPLASASTATPVNKFRNRFS